MVFYWLSFSLDDNFFWLKVWALDNNRDLSGVPFRRKQEEESIL